MSNVTAYGYACATKLPENLFHIMWKGYPTPFTVCEGIRSNIEQKMQPLS